MSKTAEFADKRNALAERLKSQTPSTPLQSVQPVAPEKSQIEKIEEQQLNVWIPKDVAKRLKKRALDSDKNLKTIVTEALEMFLKS